MNFEFSRIAISGAGFLADAYDLFVINVAVDLMNRCNYQQPLSEAMKGSIKSMALAGAVVGQLGFGAIADLIGRRKVFIVTCILVLLGALMSATAQDTSKVGIYTQLCIWRFILGVGVGGEYPLSASITSESSEEEHRAKNLAMVFSMQGIGTLLCSLVLVIVTSAMGDNDYDAQWRIALGLGGLPMAVAFYFRWKMHETSWKEESKVYQSKEQLSTSEPTVQDESSASIIRQYFGSGAIYVRHIVWRNRWRLLGTAGAWFILDIVFYANGLFSGQVTKAMGVAKSPKQESVAALILQLLALPGYFFTICYVSRIGLLRLQLLGFVATALFFFFLAGLQPYLVQVPVLYVMIYGFTFFFQNFGANATTYIIPSIIYSSAERATCHGISAAAGKLGALFGAQIFLYVESAFCPHDNCANSSSTTEQINEGLQLTFFLCGVLAVVGWGWSYFLVNDTPAASLLAISQTVRLHDHKQQFNKISSPRIDVDAGDFDEEEATVRLYEMVDISLHSTDGSSSKLSLPSDSEGTLVDGRKQDRKESTVFSRLSFFSSGPDRKGPSYNPLRREEEDSVHHGDPISFLDSTKDASPRSSLIRGSEEINNPLISSPSSNSQLHSETIKPPSPPQQLQETNEKTKKKKDSNKKKKSSSKNSSKNQQYRHDYDDDLAL